jgi:hypothetical protein
MTAKTHTRTKSVLAVRGWSIGYGLEGRQKRKRKKKNDVRAFFVSPVFFRRTTSRKTNIAFLSSAYREYAQKRKTNR